MTTPFMAVSTVVAEEGHHVVNELPVPPMVFAIIFMIVFLVLAVVTSSFSGRGIQRSETGPAELSADEREVLAEYQREHHR